ncbi:bacterial cell division membrane protein [Longilinea arvoryzae]|uniref:Bacterial cell division membrane protein n=1 Tax=Longilinea arvoryzae TaxID=360412 RepID=A0A0S7BHJ2_9CHLR|nr:FtsW/RodA/SpoVE family cell cycle protein [Longilinea arvoryzae]GAP15133.1 bacterial cell division membrane protein [Longilinea arvoryzae]
MNLLFPVSPLQKDRVQSRLFSIAALVLIAYAAALTLSPAVRLHSWAVSYRWQHWAGVVVWLAGFSLLHRILMRRAPDRDPYIVPIASVLVGLGILTIWRLNINLGERQTVWLGLAILGFAIGLRYPQILSLLRKYKYLWAVGGLIITGLTFFFGTYPGGVGPRLWLGCCGVYFQPSEVLKLFLIVYLAAYLADRTTFDQGLLQLLAPTLIVASAALILLVAQRDLGTASLFIVLYTLMVYLTSSRKRVLIIGAVLLAFAGIMGYLTISVIHVRVDAWLNPWLDPSGKSFQIVQSLISVAAGGVFGRGPGLGSPSVVPVAFSDFIFTAIGEELGLTGTLAILMLVGLLTIRGLLISIHASNNYQRFLAAGISFYLALQTILIVGGNIRLLPLTGVTLPFTSYGGSSLLTSFLALLLLTLISNQPDEEISPSFSSKAYLVTSDFLLISLLVLGLGNGYWSFIKSGDLQTRADNPRPAINDRYALRGSLLDRHNEPLAVTQGEPGSLTRRLLYPDLGPTIGYNDPLYGQSGLEASLDDYLRGIDGTPASMVWASQLLSGQPPKGLDVRLSLDASIQSTADRLLTDNKGALVLINSSTGEILALSSHPGFDPNTLEEHWTELNADPSAPFVNRVTQGVYPPGTALGPFLLANRLNKSSLPAVPTELSVGSSLCATNPGATLTWGSIIRSGCPAGMLTLLNQSSSAQTIELYDKLRFSVQPEIPLPVSPAASLPTAATLEANPLNPAGWQITPLQMALAAATLSSGGKLPAPRLASAVDTPSQGWVILTAGAATNALASPGTVQAAEQLARNDSPVWEAYGIGSNDTSTASWYLAGTLPDWQGTPLTLVVVLEGEDSKAAGEIGFTVLQAAMQPD